MKYSGTYQIQIQPERSSEPFHVLCEPLNDAGMLFYYPRVLTFSEHQSQLTSVQNSIYLIIYCATRPLSYLAACSEEVRSWELCEELTLPVGAWHD